MTTYEQIIASGKAKWKAEGKAEGKAELLLRLLGRRFGPLPDWIDERVRTAAFSTLDDWAERVLTAESVEDVLR